MVWPGAFLLLAGAIAALAGGHAGGVDVRTAGIVVMVADAALLIAGIVRLRARTAVVRPGTVGRRRRGGVRASVQGRVQEQMYRTSRGKMIAMIAAVVYILSPIDLVPDFLLPVGIIDDATAFTWLVFAIAQEVSRKRRNALPPPSG